MNEFMKKISLTDKACELVCEIYEKIKADAELWKGFDASVCEYLEKGKDCPFEKYIEELGEKLGYHKFSVHLMYLVECAIRAKAVYDEKGISEEIYYDTMTDISYKVGECEKIYGVTGVDVFAWYHVLMNANTVKLGRLEYSESELIYDSYKNFAKKGDRVYNIHIPTAGPLTYELVMDSLKRLYDYAGGGKYVIAHCGSWLIYPPYYREVFIEGSNMRMFCEQFDMIDELAQGQTAIYRWVYNIPNDAPESRIPSDTRLQRNFRKYFEEGKPSGIGRGIIVFDGEKIVNKE